MVLFVRAETGSFARAGAGGGGLRPRRRLLGPGPGAAHRPPRACAGHAAAGAVCTRRRWCGARRPGAGRGARRARWWPAASAAGITIPPVGSVVRPLLAGLLRATTPACCPPPTRWTGSPSSWSSSPVRCSPRRSSSSPRRRSRSWSPAASCSCGTVVLVTSPAVARLAAGRARPRAPPARRAGARPACARIVAATAPVGFALGATEVTMTAFATDHGSRAAAGALHGRVGGRAAASAA